MEIGESSSTFQSLAVSIQAELDNTSHQILSKCRIYRVPKLLREANEDAYTPIVVSIGPYHHKDKRLCSMESYKLKYLKSFLHHTRLDVNLNMCLKIIKEKEDAIREFYTEHIELSSDEFTRMVLIDNVFIIEIFKNYFYAFRYENDTLLGQAKITEVLRDILLLENQLSYFILEELYEMAYQPDENPHIPNFMDIACKFLGLWDHQSRIEVLNVLLTGVAQCYHLLDLVKSYTVPPEEIRIMDAIFIDVLHVKRRYMVSPTATSLHEAGVKFQVSYANNVGLLGIHFNKKKGILTIPKLRTEDRDQSLLKNIIAFEQCKYLLDTTTYFTDYYYFLDCLINTPQDMQLLADAGIIENWLGCEVLCDMFNTIRNNTIISWWNYYYADLSEQLINHCNNRWNRRKATLKHKYCRHPWAVISLIYASILLFLTLIQVAMSILAVPGLSKES